ncbi:winged helix-turn-helix domain-containing protein [Pseudomonas putida]|uniref:ArsR/SmtB family transcription factor n=1 Tax=Pseudomonas putida TaxID=303 RepID=UPI0023646A38|nr:winged helix-turn-helix domain-containing protein [Pseudomonas putida]MDD2054275.1 winged helix-turn-helix domain-containing protein [Pseudomonas putida]
MTELNEALKVLSSPNRREILALLKDPDQSFAGLTQLYDFAVYGVCASLIQERAGLSQPATSLCLKALLDIGFVKASKVGKWTYYQRSEASLVSAVTDLLETLQIELD